MHSFLFFLACRLPTTVCPSGLRGWTQVPLARAAWVQIPQLSISAPRVVRTHAMRCQNKLPPRWRHCVRRAVRAPAHTGESQSVARGAPSQPRHTHLPKRPPHHCHMHTWRVLHPVSHSVAATRGSVCTALRETMRSTHSCPHLTLAGLEPAIFGSED